MVLTTKQLKQIIKEELESVVESRHEPYPPYDDEAKKAISELISKDSSILRSLGEETYTVGLSLFNHEQHLSMYTDEPTTYKQRLIEEFEIIILSFFRSNIIRKYFEKEFPNETDVEFNPLDDKGEYAGENSDAVRANRDIESHPLVRQEIDVVMEMIDFLDRMYKVSNLSDQTKQDSMDAKLLNLTTMGYERFLQAFELGG